MWIDGLCFAVLYVVYFYPRWKNKELLAHTLIYLYLVSVFLLTLSPCVTALTSMFSHSYQPMMMEPFRDFIAGYENADWQIILNIIMLVPLGFLLPKIRNYNGYQVVWVSFLLSCAIEIVQPLLSVYRRSDITDIICNTLGGLVGYLLYKIIHKIK